MSQRLPKTAQPESLMTEKQLLECVRSLAKGLGWLTYHTHNSRRSEPGFPDLVMVRPPRLIFAELKNEKGVVSDAQERWLLELGKVEDWLYDFDDLYDAEVVVVHVWRPAQWLDGTIEEILR